MERLVKARKPVRASFTKTSKEIFELISAEEVDNDKIQVLLTKLERLYTELSPLDEKVLDLLLDENEDVYDNEYSTIESYRDKLDEVRQKISNIQVKIEVMKANRSTFPTPQFEVNRKHVRLPKLELAKFGGEVKDWLRFWSQFKRIHDDEDIETEDKFQYLIQCTVSGSRAREIVNSFPPTASNYPKVVGCLISRFGRDELLIEHYIRELLALVVLKTSKKEKNNISFLYDKLESQLRSLESLGMTKEKYASMLFPMVESCLPEEILRVWLRNQTVLPGVDQSNCHSSKLELLLGFLKNEVEGEERIRYAQAGFGLTEGKTQGKVREKTEEMENIPTASSLFTSKQMWRGECVFCGKAHESKECFLAQQMNLLEKQKKLSEGRSCFSCLRLGHREKHCKANIRCPLCRKKHVVLMCPNLEVNRVEDNKKTEKGEEEIKPTSIVMNSQSVVQEILLQTVLVKLKHGKKEKIVRALVDSGSQRSYILQRTASEMGYSPLESETMIHTLFGGVETSKQCHHLYEVSVNSLNNDYSTKFRVLDQKTICGRISRLKYGQWMQELKEKKIWISDFGQAPPEVELLIGADVAGRLFVGDIQKLKSGLVAMKTMFGWTVMGKLTCKENSDSSASLVNALFIQSASVSDLWNLDAIGIHDPYETKSRKEMELAALKHFQQTVKIEDGRYQVTLPWLESRQYIKENKELAKKRCISATQRLIKEGKYEDYDNVFEAWLKEGVIEKVPVEELDDFGYYLPHRGVFKENSTTKVRPVFDASCKPKDSPSLNDCLEKGPNLMEVIPAVLMRFREKKIGVISDIKKAFLQIFVNKNDCDFLRFLWWENFAEGRMKIFRHRRVVFGVNCSPFLLAAVLDLHLRTTPKFKETAKKLRRSFYVDNCVSSVDTEEELKTFIDESRQILSEAQFDLRGWENSCPGKKAETSVLGLTWDLQEDVLSCGQMNLKNFDGKCTRRNVLSIANSIFDPIGFICPVTLIPKLLLQRTWELKMSWDAEMDDDSKKKFERWLKEIKALPEIKIPRHLVNCTSKTTWSLHTFCDASQLAYAAAVFLRSENNHDICVQLVQAKSRVAPLKRATIPRLELLACCIGARLASSVKGSLKLVNIPSLYWTDSTTALCWIKRDDSWGIFVANRVKEIRILSDPESWNHVAGVCNPADLPSRGCNPSQLLDSRWWKGPSWLQQDSSEWPSSYTEPNEEEISREKKKGIFTLISLAEEPWYLKYFSSYSKIVRMIGWIRRFLHNTREKENRVLSTELSVTELKIAERRLLRIVQNETFNRTEKSNLKSLCFFEDEEGLVRIKTKITRRSDEEDFRSPILIPSDHKITNILIMEEHIRSSHAGVQILLSILRERFWILKGRKTVRRVVSKCMKCRKYEAKRTETDPVPLPEDRVRDASVFEIVGVDLAGPLHLKGDVKSWIVIFTCAVYRAVHFELVMSLSTSGFIQAFRRFIARRGRPQIVYSDNGTNFVGTNNLFKAVDWKRINKETSDLRIEWKFNPPTAAWWGGWWERLIQMVKRLLRRVLGRTSVNYEEMMTILTDCEAVINARPLTYLSEDQDDLKVLTPAMFIQDIQKVGVPDLDCIEKISFSKRYKYQQHLKEELRRRFRLEYLGQLVQRHNEKRGQRQIQPGEVVLIGSDNKKRIDWPIGRVVAVFPGRDHKVRVVKVKTSSGEMIRPVQHIYPLEVCSTSNSLIESETKPTSTPVPDAALQDAKNMTRSGRRVNLPSRLICDM